MSEDRDAAAKIANPHGFMVEWMRIMPENGVGPFRLTPRQVVIVREGALEIELGIGADASRAIVEPWGTFSIPEGVWRSFRSVGDGEALFSVTTAGDARPRIDWHPEIVAAARSAGIGHDPNGYLAPAHLLPQG